MQTRRLKDINSRYSKSKKSDRMIKNKETGQNEKRADSKFVKEDVSTVSAINKGLKREKTKRRAIEIESER